MKEEMARQAAELLATLNTALKAGVEKLPGAAREALEQLSVYYYAKGIGGIAILLLCAGAVVACLKLTAKASRVSADKESEYNAEVPWVIAAVACGAAAIMLGVGGMIESFNFVDAVAPLGSLLAKSVGSCE